MYYFLLTQKKKKNKESCNWFRPIYSLYQELPETRFSWDEAHPKMCSGKWHDRLSRLLGEGWWQFALHCAMHNSLRWDYCNDPTKDERITRRANTIWRCQFLWCLSQECSGNKYREGGRTELLGKLNSTRLDRFCWTITQEHGNALLKYHTYSQREDIHVSAWPQIPKLNYGQMHYMSQEGVYHDILL